MTSKNSNHSAYAERLVGVKRMKMLFLLQVFGTSQLLVS